MANRLKGSSTALGPIDFRHPDRLLISQCAKIGFIESDFGQRWYQAGSADHFSIFGIIREAPGDGGCIWVIELDVQLH